MPVSNTQRGQADGAIRSIHAGVGSERVYRQVMAVRPKGFRASILKLIDWPTSWGVLYDLSPAQISQNREAEAARETWEATGTSYAGGANKARMWMTLLGAYFLGQPDPMSESNFPSWRKPSWMTDEEQRRIKEFIRASYEADAPLAQTMPVEDVPREQRMADLAEREEAQAVTVPQSPPDDGEGSEPFENEGAQESSQAQENPFESLYALYQAYWRRVFLIRDAEDLRDKINPVSLNHSPTIKNAAVTIYALEKLGYEYTGIKNLLQAMANRGLGVVGIRPGNRNGFNAYLLLDLKAERISATKYRSGVAYNIMSETCRTSVSTLKGQFERSDRRNLQVFKFSGSGARLVGVQVVSLNYINGGSNADTFQEGNRKVRIARDEARAQVAEFAGAVRPESTSAPSTPSGTDQYSFMAFQTFRERQTFMEEGQLFRKGNLNGQRQSTIFYFAKRNPSGTYTLYRSVFGVAELNVLRFDNTTMGIEGLKRAWNESGKLNERDKISVQRVPVLDLPKLKRAYRAMLQNEIASRAFKPVRSQEAPISIPFNSIVRMTLEVNDALLESFPAQEENDELAGGSSVENTQDNARIAESVKAIKTQKIDRTFAYEIEAGMFDDEGQPVRDRTTRLRQAISEVLQERGLSRDPDGVSRWLVNDGIRSQQITMAGDGSVDSPGGFEIDTPVFVPPNVDTAKTNYDEAVSMRRFNEYKWQSYPKMWEWVAVLSEALLRAGVRIHKSSGLHIHVSNSDYTLEDKGRYLRNYAGFEPLLDLMMPINSRRGGRSYNASLIQKGIITTGYSRYNRYNRPKTHKKTPYGSLERAVREGSTNALGDVGGRAKVRFPTGIDTIEFRHPMTNIEGDLIKHFIILAYGLVEVSKIKQFTSFKFDDLASFLPPATATFLYNRIEDLDQPSVKDLIEMNITFNEVVEERNSDGDITGYKLKRRKEEDVLKEFNDKFYVNDNRERGSNDRGTGSALKRKKLGE